ncbi:MAG: ABC transporter ATP-binding protein [Nitrososphaerota archaeon]|nr:ABC transporter ATP-binding protein [Nitrososphaerota archaeon]
MKTVTVEAEGLKRDFDFKGGRVVALDGVDLEVQEGEIFGVLGPNGAGKTTLIRILSTLLLPTGGRARVMGHDVAGEPERVRPLISMASGAERVGWDYISARANLWFFSQLYGIPSGEARRRVDELSRELGLTENLDKKFYALSTGYKQRLTMVRAFINDPRVVFLDEPTIGLDVMTSLSIREFLLAQAREHGRTIMMATHNMAEVDAMCDKVAIIDRGRILASGTPASLKRSLGVPALVLEMALDSGDPDSLRSVEGVQGMTSAVDAERGVVRVKLLVKDERCADLVMEAAARSGCSVFSHWMQGPTLEEVFVSLVGRGFSEREKEVA